jgi:tetratricopeptide (TPR) repeat protein
MGKTALDFIAFCSANWPFLFFIITVLGLLFGRVVYGISPLYWLEDIKHKQDEHDKKIEEETFKRRMVGRHIELGHALLDVYELEAARANYKKALALDELSVEAQMGVLKAEIFLSVRRKDYSPQVAEKQLQLIQAENPNDKHAFLFLGDVYMYIEPERALEYFDKALQQDPNLAVVHNFIGYLHDQKGESDEALACYQKAAALEKWNTMILSNAAYHTLRKKLYHDAIRQFDLLLRLDPKLLWAYWSLVQAYRLVDNLQNAYAWQQALMSRLEDDAITSLPVNQSELLFYAGDELLYLYGLPQIRCFSYYSAALTCHLMAKAAEAEAWLQKARSLSVEDRTPLEKLLRSYISELQQEQSSYDKQLQEFTQLCFAVVSA